MQIGRRTIMGEPSRRPCIASVFARPGIPGYIFLEGNLPDVLAAVKGLVTVYNALPRLVPSEQRVTLLSRSNPISRHIQEGTWVRCLHGLYRGDVGLVCGYDASSDAEAIVAFVPRIPTKSFRTASAKRKRVARPEPQTWSARQVEEIWGPSQVRKTSEDEFVFRHETYKSGLISKQLPPRV